MTSGVLGGRPGLRWLAVTVLVTGAGALSIRRGRPYWLGSPTVALGQAQDLTIFGSAIVTAYGAWLSGHSRTLGERLLAAPRRRQEVDRGPLVFAASAGFLGYCSVLTWMLFSGSARDGGWTQVLANKTGLVSTVLMLAGSATFWAGVGVCAGRWLPRLAALAVAPFLAYATYLVLAVYVSTSSLTGLSLGGNLVYASVEPTVTTWSTKALFWTCLAALTTAAITAGQQRTVSAAAWATGVSAALVIIGGAPVQTVPAAAPVCRGESPQVCVNASNRAVLGDYDRQVRRLWVKLPVRLRASTVADSVAAPQLGSRSQMQLLVAGPIDGTIEPANTINVDEFAAYLGDRAIARACPATNSSEGASGALKLWWRMSLGLPAGASYPGAPDFATAAAQLTQQAEDLAAMTDAARNAWVEAHLIAACPTAP